MMEYPKLKFRLIVDVIETTESRHTVGYSIEENDSTMKEIGLALYKLKQVEQELIDREWDEGGEGYEIEEGDANGI